MVLQFVDFELNRQRGELRGAAGEVIKLRPKTFAMLSFFAENPGRVLSKRELMEAVWPDVHIGDDSLFHCILEIRTAIGDDRRDMIRLVSGRGYVFAVEVTADALTSDDEAASTATALPDAQPATKSEEAWRSFGLRHRAVLAIAGLGTMLGLAIAVATVWSGVVVEAGRPSIIMMPIAAEGNVDVTAMASTVTSRLADGLAKIDNIRLLMVSQAGPAQKADFVVTGDLHKTERSWEARVRMTRSSSGEVVWTAPVSVPMDEPDVSLQQSRLVASVGYPLALRINELLNADARPPATDGLAKAAIEQATAAIKQTSRDRFATAEAILKTTLAGDDNNVDLAVALAGLQLRGVQMSWYPPAERAAAEKNSKSVLEHALRVKPGSIPVLEAYCRFLNATNEFAESLVACSRALDFEPWDAPALYNLGLSQLQLGLLDDALATFKRAHSYDTPVVSRWTWRLGMGWTYALMERNSDALPWVQSAIAITPASGRSLILLAAIYESLGRHSEATEAMKSGLALRPGSNITNIDNPTKNAGPVFLEATARLRLAFIAAGLPEK